MAHIAYLVWRDRTTHASRAESSATPAFSSEPPSSTSLKCSSSSSYTPSSRPPSYCDDSNHSSEEEPEPEELPNPHPKTRSSASASRAMQLSRQISMPLLSAARKAMPSTRPTILAARMSTLPKALLWSPRDDASEEADSESDSDVHRPPPVSDEEDMDASDSEGDIASTPLRSCHGTFESPTPVTTIDEAPVRPPLPYRATTSMSVARGEEPPHPHLVRLATAHPDRSSRRTMKRTRSCAATRAVRPACRENSLPAEVFERRFENPFKLSCPARPHWPLSRGVYFAQAFLSSPETCSRPAFYRKYAPRNPQYRRGGKPGFLVGPASQVRRPQAHFACIPCPFLSDASHTLRMKSYISTLYSPALPLIYPPPSPECSRRRALFYML